MSKLSKKNSPLDEARPFARMGKVNIGAHEIMACTAGTQTVIIDIVQLRCRTMK